MIDTNADSSQSLARERDALVRSGSLHVFQWLVIVLSLLLTVSVWQFARQQVARVRAADFQRETEQLVSLITDRMEGYAVALHSGVATLATFDGSMTHEQWQAYAQGLTLENYYPGVNGIGVVRSISATQIPAFEQAQHANGRDFAVYPSHEYPEKFPILYIEPEAANAAAIGLDLGHETNRRVAAIAARDSGQIQVTGPIVLVQDAKSTPGFLFYAPIYNTPDGQPPAEVEARRRLFAGMVYAPFIVSDLMAGTLDVNNRRVGLRLLDGDEVLFDDNQQGAQIYDPRAGRSTTIATPLYGRAWKFEMHDLRAGDASAAGIQSNMILVAGLIGNALLATMFFALSRARREAIVFADKVNDELAQKTAALTRSNEELESFAYIASHDLRTPVRGVSNISQYLREDLEPFLATKECPPDVSTNIDRLEQQASRMNALIEGILAYSKVGGQDLAVERFDLTECVDDLRDALEVGADQLQVSSSAPAFETYKVRLQQVIANLVGNAFKYHDNADGARVVVKRRVVGDRVHFSVSDNGPGIESQYHERIFEVFQKLETKDTVEGSGVGLSIVKKTVELLDGTIHLASAPGEGARFSFDWPLSVAPK